MITSLIQFVVVVDDFDVSFFLCSKGDCRVSVAIFVDDGADSRRFSYVKTSYVKTSSVSRS